MGWGGGEGDHKYWMSAPPMLLWLLLLLLPTFLCHETCPWGSSDALCHLSPFRQLLSICMPSCGAPRLRWYATSSRPMTKEQTVNLARQYILNNNMIYKCFKIDNNVQIKYKIIKYINKHFNLRAKRSLSWQALSHHTHAEQLKAGIKQRSQGSHSLHPKRVSCIRYLHMIIRLYIYMLVCARNWSWK